MEIVFRVSGQTVIRLDSKEVSEDSIGFLRARFKVSADWFSSSDPLVLKAVFEKGGRAYHVLLDDDLTCEVAHEVLTERGFFHVGLVGLAPDGSSSIIRATTVRERVKVERGTSVKGENSVKPTPDELEQITARLAALGLKLSAIETTGQMEALCQIEGAEYRFVWLAPDTEYENSALKQGYIYTITYSDDVYTLIEEVSLRGPQGFRGDRGAPGEALKVVQNSSELKEWCVELPSDVHFAYCLAGTDFEYSFALGSSGISGDMYAGDVWRFSRADYSFDFCYNIIGTDGKDGDDGKNGVDGYSPSVIITKTDGITSVRITDKNGEHIGKIKDGDDGITPHIGENGNWWIGETDTGVHAVGGTGGGTITVLSDNLFDKSSVIGNGVFSYSANGYTLVEGTNSYYAFVPLRGAGTYRTKFNWSEHEWSGARIALVDNDNGWVTNATGTVTPADDNTEYDFEFTVTQAMINQGATKIAFDFFHRKLDTIMIVKDREYPTKYIPYGYIEVLTEDAKKVPNILTEKTAVFLGDSICAASTEYEGAMAGYGWAGLIGEANDMVWKNCGRDGGTITDLVEVSSGLWLSTQVDVAYAAHPDADYVIFEGGCNDADRMKDGGLGEISTGYSNFDKTTFSGAFETLVLKMINTFSKAKIGYIIPPKMHAVNDHTAKGHVHRRFFDRAVEICQKWGVPVIDLWNGCPMNPKLIVYYDSSIPKLESNAAGKYYTDGQHLTITGYKYIAPLIEAWMRNLYINGDARGGGSVTVDSALSNTSENPVQNKVITEKITEVETTIGNIDVLLGTI